MVLVQHTLQKCREPSEIRDTSLKLGSIHYTIKAKSRETPLSFEELLPPLRLVAGMTRSALPHQTYQRRRTTSTYGSLIARALNLPHKFALGMFYIRSQSPSYTEKGRRRGLSMTDENKKKKNAPQPNNSLNLTYVGKYTIRTERTC